MTQTKQQKRAAFALKQIKNFKDTKKDDKEFHDLANFIVGMPNMILSNGLGQTLAFLLTKKDKQKKTFFIIKEWLESSDNSFFSTKESVALKIRLSVSISSALSSKIFCSSSNGNGIINPV